MFHSDHRSDKSIRLFDFTNGSILGKVLGYSELITGDYYTNDGSSQPKSTQSTTATRFSLDQSKLPTATSSNTTGYLYQRTLEDWFTQLSKKGFQRKRRKKRL
ncbi:24794_t:CDS:2 [Dentiscutata erythropus]|uniref:24794_t:CDS:1 n=1 Tax=Dentiscutata erythropus TaxID=1348616 RepID=A0A9N9E835_9GLOM|nr:24794_t:CDS:2 [Dentiscutata erythropus]